MRHGTPEHEPTRSPAYPPCPRSAFAPTPPFACVPQVHTKHRIGLPLFVGESSLHICAVNEREELLCRLIDLVVNNLPPATAQALLRSQATGVFFNDAPMKFYGGTPLSCERARPPSHQGCCAAAAAAVFAPLFSLAALFPPPVLSLAWPLSRPAPLCVASVCVTVHVGTSQTPASLGCVMRSGATWLRAWSLWTRARTRASSRASFLCTRSSRRATRGCTTS